MPMPIDVRARVHQLIAILAIAISTLLIIPFEPAFCPADGTGGWPTRIAADLADRRQFGVETVFIYGPFGVVPLRTYYPGTYLMLILGSTLIAAAFIASNLHVFARAGLSPLARSLLTLLVATIATSQFDRVGTEPIFNLLVAFVPLLSAVRGGERTNPLLELLLGAALAVAGLGKFNYFIGAVGVITIVAAFDVWQRRLPRAAIAFVTSLPVLWLVAGQPLANLPRFLAISLNFASGYTEAMSIVAQTRDAVGFVVAAAPIALGVMLFRRAGTLTRDELSTVFSWAFWVFLVLKTAVVRQDEHVLSASITILATGVLLASLVRSSSNSLRLATSASMLLAIAAISISLVALGATLTVELMRPVRTVSRQLRALHQFIVDPDWLEQRHRSNLAAAKSLTPMPRMSGTVDFLPNSSTIPLAHGLPQRSNPVVMSYVGPHTPRLAEIQANHFRRADGPRTVIVFLETIDDHYPSLDLGPSLLELLANYEVGGQMGKALVLSRRSVRRKFQFEPIVDRRLRPGESIEIQGEGADASLVWARLRVRGGAGRAINSFLYRSPVFHIRATTARGAVFVKRFIPRAGEAGFLLSPYLTDVRSLEELFAGAHEAPDAIVAFSIDVEPSFLPQMESVSVELFGIREAK